MKQTYRVLTINPGSTSTKIAVFEGEHHLFDETIKHSTAEIQEYSHVMDQYSFRLDHILNTLDHNGFNLSNLDAVCGRGGLLYPIEGGTYEVNDAMLKDLKEAKNGEHASNLGAILAYEIAKNINVPAFIVDPVVVDELDDLARLSGLPQLPRKSIFHALNQKAVARRAAFDLGKSYEESRLVVCHMGGGITVGSHANGKVIDVNNGLNGEGPFSPERAGTIPAGQLVDFCYSNVYSKEEVHKMLTGNGGLVAYLDTNDALEVEKRIKQGESHASYVYDAMIYQIAKEIGAHATVLEGKIDAIVLTGGLAHGKELVQAISKKVDWVSNVKVYPGENELEALAFGAIRVLKEEEQAKLYTSTP